MRVKQNSRSLWMLPVMVQKACVYGTWSSVATWMAKSRFFDYGTVQSVACATNKQSLMYICCVTVVYKLGV